MSVCGCICVFSCDCVVVVSLCVGLDRCLVTVLFVSVNICVCACVPVCVPPWLCPVQDGARAAMGPPAEDP